MKRLVAILFLILLLGCQQLPLPSNQAALPKTWTGFLEGETLDVSAQAAGRLMRLAVVEGESVQPGQALFALDDELVRRRMEVADANVAAADAQLKQTQAGARPEDLARAIARVDQVRAALEVAEQGVVDAEAIRSQPQALQLARAQADLRAQSAALQLDAAIKQAQAADLENNFWQDQVRILWDGLDVTLPDGSTRHFDTPQRRVSFAQDQWNAASHRAWQAWAAVAAAQANQKAADAALKDIQDQLDHPLALDAKIDQARSARDRAAANVQAAVAALQALRDGTGLAQIEAARSALDQARAVRASLDRDLSNYTVSAPRAGRVTRLFYREGEVVPSATPVVRLTIEGDLTLRVFVPMSELISARVGQPVNVWLPDLANRSASGTVSHIADQAEFTGRQPQTDSERNAQLVAVEIKLSRPDAAIKAGMPASVSFAGEETGAGLPSSAGQGAKAEPAAGLIFSGTLEERQTRLAAELEGQIRMVSVSRGDAVKPGDALVELDDGDIRNALDEAGAAVRMAQANLDSVQEPTRPGNLALADAGVAQAQAELDAARRAAEDAARALGSPQELQSQLHAWEGKVMSAQADLQRAEAARSDLQRQIEQAVNDQSMAGKAQLAILQKQAEAAEVNRASAQLSMEKSRGIADLIRGMIANPLDLLAALHAADGQVKVGQAGLTVAQAERAVSTRGPQSEAVALAHARLQAAQASRRLVEAQAKRLLIASPMAGRVVDRQGEVGETARPGIPLLTLADPRELELTVYIPAREMGAIHIGQAAGVRLPSLPGRTFDAKITYIAPEAEFKPANIYNSQDRSEMVFAVRLTVPNPSDELKAGLPADASLQ